MEYDASTMPVSGSPKIAKNQRSWESKRAQSGGQLGSIYIPGRGSDKDVRGGAAGCAATSQAFLDKTLLKL
jgi:hypothetical protein